jgi:cobalamin biosynthesis Mg chelatase CobN
VHSSFDTGLELTCTFKEFYIEFLTRFKDVPFIRFDKIITDFIKQHANDIANNKPSPSSGGDNNDSNNNNRSKDVDSSSPSIGQQQQQQSQSSSSSSSSSSSDSASISSAQQSLLDQARLRLSSREKSMQSRNKSRNSNNSSRNGMHRDLAAPSPFVDPRTGR